MFAFTCMKESKQPAFDVAAYQISIVHCISHRYVLLNTRREMIQIYISHLLCPLQGRNARKTGDFSAQGWNMPKMNIPTCSKCQVNRTLYVRFSVSSIVKDERIYTVIDRANTIYTESHVCRHISTGDDTH